MSDRSPRAGQPADPATLVDVAALLAAYHDITPDPADPAQRVAFGTSGHRGSAFKGAFNEAHILAISEAICRYRARHGLRRAAVRRARHARAVRAGDPDRGRGPRRQRRRRPARRRRRLHPDAGPVARGHRRQPGRRRGRPAARRRDRRDALAQPAGGRRLQVQPAHTAGRPTRTSRRWIQDEANRILEASGSDGLAGVARVPYERALAQTTPYDFLGTYVDDLPSVVDLAAVAASGLRIGVDPMGGASVAYWAAIAERHGLDLTVTNDVVDPTFGFMTLDWDGRIRMDPSSTDAMARLVAHARPVRPGPRQRRRRGPPRRRHARAAGCSTPTTSWPRPSPTCSAGPGPGARTSASARRSSRHR